MQREIKQSGLIILLAASFAQAATFTANVYTSTASLYTDLIAKTTTAYDAKVSQSQYFPNTITITISGKKPETGTQALPSFEKMFQQMIENSTATWVYGWVSGMEEERAADIGLVHEIQGQEYKAGLCGGDRVADLADTIDERVKIINACAKAYALAVSSITARGYAIYTTTGGVVGP